MFPHKNNPVMPLDQPETNLISRQEVGDSLRLLDRSSAWFLWSSVVGLVLLPGAIALLSLPSALARIGSLDERGVILLGRGVLCFVWVVNVCTLFWRRHLKVLRKRLVEQMDLAAKQRARADALYGLSILDPLTGLYNRRYGENRLREEIGRAERSGDPLLLLALDFDRFKEINDQYGHAAGDLALKTFSRRLQRAVRACDVPIRVGGDEFLVILPECSQDKVQLILSRMYPVEVNVEGQKIPVSFSYGVSQYQVNDAPETMIARADERLYAEKAKRAGVEV